MNYPPNDPTTQPGQGQTPPPPQYSAPLGYPPQSVPPQWPPQQQPMQPPPKKKKKGWLIALGIVIGAVVLCGVIATANSNSGTKVATTNNGTNSSTNNASQPEQKQPAVAPAQHFKPGDVVKVADTWEIIVNEVKTSPGGQYDSLKDGYIYLLADVSMKNISNEERYAATLNWALKDASGQKYNDTYMSEAPQMPSGKTESGSTTRGTLVYEVPVANKQFTLAYENNLFSSGQTIWDIVLP